MTTGQNNGTGACRKEQEQHEEERLAEVAGYIGYQSHFYSRSAPDQKDDIAQVAQEAVVKLLRDDPDCPISHLKVKAKSTILNYLKQGSSVDGKLDQSDRSRTYDTLSLDAPASEQIGTPREEVLGREKQSFTERITEERALDRISMDELRSQLSNRENQALDMRLDGASWQEVTSKVGNSAGDYRSPVRRHLEKAAKGVLTTEAPYTNGNGRNGGGRSF